MEEGPKPCALGGMIWEYWRDVSRPSGRGIALPVEEISGEVESENLCKATLIEPGRVLFPVRKTRCYTWVIVTNRIPYSEAVGKDCFFLSCALRQFLSQTHPRCCPLMDAVSLLHQQKSLTCHLGVSWPHTHSANQVDPNTCCVTTVLLRI